MSRRTPAPAGGTPAASTETATAAPANTAPAPAPETADTPAPAADLDPAELVEARALIAFGDHLANDVVTGSAEEISALVAEGLVDDDPVAVDYAKSLLAG